MKIDLHSIFNDLMNDYITKTHRKKLKEQDLIIIRDFLDATKNLDSNARQLLINRLFIDQPDKPKHWAYINEFLQFINSRAYRIEFPHNLHRGEKA